MYACSKCYKIQSISSQACLNGTFLLQTIIIGYWVCEMKKVVDSIAWAKENRWKLKLENVCVKTFYYVNALNDCYTSSRRQNTNLCMEYWDASRTPL